LSAGGIRGLSRTTRYLIIETMTPTRPSSSKISRLLFGALAYVSLAIGLIAIVVPGLPTTEFILLAAWAATKSSPRLSAWMENHRLFGPILCNWRNGRIVSRKAKVSATVSMLLCAGLMLTLLNHHWTMYAAIAGMTLGNLWIWSRPEALPQAS
jgi:uncharacterized membrane protein YbaN (DUF454 family)